MTTTRRFRRGLISVPLSTLLLVLSVAIPLVERADLAHETILESQHEPGTCPAPHDHTVCTQAGANHGTPGRASVVLPFAVVAAAVVATTSERYVSAAAAFHQPARAPPSA